MLPSGSVDLNRLHAWATAELVLPRESASADVRLAILHKLEVLAFAPSAIELQAIQIVTGTTSALQSQFTDAYLTAVETELCEKVDRFTRDFFQLDPPERRQRWAQLQETCAAWPQLRLWLNRLAPGLDVVLPAVTDRDTDLHTLCEFLGRRFVARPGHNVDKFWDEYGTKFVKQSRWQSVAWRLRRKNPALGQLFAPWLGDFARSSNLISRLSRVRRAHGIPDLFDRVNERLYQIIVLAVTVYILSMIGSGLFERFKPWFASYNRANSHAQSANPWQARKDDPLDFDGLTPAQIKAKVLRNAKTLGERYPYSVFPDQVPGYRESLRRGITYTPEEILLMRPPPPGS